MKKEKRELTLWQLETKEKIAKKVVKILVIVFEIFTVVYLVTGVICVIERFHSKTILLSGIPVLLFLLIVVSITCKVLEKIRNQITLKKDRMKLKVLKHLAKENGGNIKAFVSLKDEKAITDILSKGIEKVVIDFTQDLKVGITTIYFSNDGFQSDVITSKESFISSLDEECKKKILNNCVESIELTEFGGNKKQIVISGPGFCYVDEKKSEDEMLEMFELKE